MIATALRTRRKLVAVAVGFGAIAALSSSASAEVIDQANDQYPPTSYHSIFTGYGEGQSFRPTLDLVDFIRICVMRMGFLYTGPVTFVIDLHHESRLSPVIATTAPVIVDGADPIYATFLFAAPVTLIPGDTYVFIVRYTAGTDNWGIGAHNLNPYPYGQLIATWGNPELYDAWFQEGTGGSSAVTVGDWASIKAEYR